MSSSSAWMSTMVRLIFCVETATPALMVTRFATLAFRFMSACNLSTSRSMRPTDRFGTFSSTSGGAEEVAEGADAIVKGIVREAVVEGVTEGEVGGGGPAAPTVKQKRLTKRARRARRDNITNKGAKMDVIGDKEVE